MAYTTIDKPADYFQVVAWTGNATDDRAINIDMQPDMVWWKHRTSSSYWHYVVDSSRGIGKQLYTNGDDTEGTHTGGHVKSYTSTGITIDDDQAINHGSTTYIGWMWKANGGSTTSGGGTDSIATSTYQANTTSKFSIVTYTGESSAKTVAHGLGVKPNAIFVKCRQTKDWHVYFDGGQVSDPETDYLRFNTNLALTDNDTSWNDTAPTTSVFTIGSGSGGDANGNTDTFVAYCFANVQGYSKFGTYTGNGNADGAFVYTGFKPAWVMQKRTNSDTDAHWHIFDIKRDTKNPRIIRLEGNNNFADSTGEGADFLSNGFKWRSNDVRYNGSSDTYVYMAFAENPFVSSEGVPCTAGG